MCHFSSSRQSSLSQVVAEPICLNKAGLLAREWILQCGCLVQDGLADWLVPHAAKAILICPYMQNKQQGNENSSLIVGLKLSPDSYSVCDLALTKYKHPQHQSAFTACRGLEIFLLQQSWSDEASWETTSLLSVIRFKLIEVIDCLKWPTVMYWVLCSVSLVLLWFNIRLQWAAVTVANGALCCFV